MAWYLLKHTDNFTVTFRPYQLFLTQGMYSRDSSVGIALGDGLDDRGSGIRFSAGAGKFSLHHRVHNGSGVHPASYPTGNGGSFPGGKAAGAWSWPLVPRSMRGAIPPLPQYVFMVWCLVKHRVNFTFYLFTQGMRNQYASYFIAECQIVHSVLGHTETVQGH
jgi:hypothetical protein